MDKFQTTGAVVAILLLFFQLFDRIPAISRFVRNSICLPKRGWQMLRQGWYWRQHSPSFLITKSSSFVIVKSDGSTEIEVTGAWQSREASINKTIIDGSVTLDIGSSYPKLSCHSNILTLNQKPVNITYKFRGTVCASPYVNLDELLKQIRPRVKCKIEVEKVQLRNFGYRSLKLKSFPANVEWRDS